MEGKNLRHRDPPQQGPGGHPPQHTDETGRQCLPGPALSTALLGEPKPRRQAGTLAPRLRLSLRLHRVLVAARGPCQAAVSGCCPPSAVQASRCGGLSRPGARAPGRRASGVVAHGLSCSKACGILVPRPGMEPKSPSLQGGFLTTGSSGKSPTHFLSFFFF